MTYELWTGDVLLGHSTLDFPTTSPRIFSGEFEPVAKRESLVAEIAVAMYCLIAWIHRDVRNPLGQHLVKQAYRNSRLFGDITKVVEARNVYLQLRHTDGRIIPTACLVVQDMETPPANADLVTELIRAEDEDEDEDEEDAEDDDEDDAEAAIEESKDYGWEFDGPPPLLRPRFHLHVMIEQTGDIPADNMIEW